MIAVVAVAGAAAIAALGDLTVPPDRLPASCAPSASRLVRVSGNTFRDQWVGLPITSNPATSSEPRVVVAIRERIEGLRTTPDPPALTARDLARFRAQLADGIDEAYAAVYQEPDSSEYVAVYGLRFADTLAATEFWSTAAAAKNARITALTSGPIVAIATGTRGACFDAVAAHLKSLQ